MSIDIGINHKTNDIAYSNGKMYIVNGGNEVAQRAATRIRRIKGEWANYTPAGIPYFSEILGSKRVAVFNLKVRGEILKTDGVEEIKNYNMIFDNKTQHAAIYSEIKVNGEFFPISEDL